MHSLVAKVIGFVTDVNELISVKTKVAVKFVKLVVIYLWFTLAQSYTLSSSLRLRLRGSKIHYSKAYADSSFE